MIGVVSMALSAAAFGDTSDFKIAADSSSGTYAKMLGEIISVCSDDNLNVHQATGVTGGAVGNLDALVNNKAQAAFLHSDVYVSLAQSDSSYKRFQTLVALWPEPIHVLALRVSKTKKPGYVSFGTQDINTLVDTRGFAVGAAGGGVYTAKILQGNGEGGFRVISYDTGAQVIAALDSGEIAAAIFVGAQPLPNIEKLNKAVYKLIPIGEAIASRVTGTYRPATINYQGLSNGSIKTLAPVATLLTKKYSTPEKLETQRKFRACFNKHLPELKDNNSPNWQYVEAGDKGVLDWYEIPDAPTTVNVAATGKVKK